ncbi:MAG: helix-turn-helix domain-containing protein [Microscillaceae bacterium]|jgi:AraC-like DNA-binding protein|nr:helix-turn-helix domain-containing protein [Microscillaceae bacterium]
MTIYIKNMVCQRCVMAVEQILKSQNIDYQSITLGEVEILKDLDKAQKSALSIQLQSIGFELIDDKKSQMIEKIKNLVIDLAHYSNNQLKVNLSHYLADKLAYDYKYLSNLFSEIEGITIEHYYIAQKIEKVKELLVYNELSLSEIAFQLGYSSVAHLSNQFKKVTGLTPSHFKNIQTDKRKPIDKV